MIKRRRYYAMPEMDRMSLEEIEIYQAKKLVKQLRYCYDNSSFYKKKFDEIGAKPEDITTIDALRKLPIFMTKDTERRLAKESLEKYGHPFGIHLCADVKKVYLTGTTSGTTGTPTFTYTFTKKDLNFIGKNLGHRFKFIGVSPGERVLFFFALGVYATTMTLWGLRFIGALPIDIDARAGTDILLQFAQLTKPNYLACTPSLAEYLIDKAPKVINKDVSSFNLKGLLLTGEIGIAIPEIKKKLEDAYKCKTYDYWAPAGNALGVSCGFDEYQGLHALSPNVCTSYQDLVDPITKEPIEIKDGAIGEMVHTSLEREACPAIKYAYGDVVEIFTSECPGCGFKGIRAKIIGRSDDMLIVKGVNVYPAAIKKIVTDFRPKVTGEMRIVLSDPPPRVTPPLKLKIEYGIGVEKSQLESLAKEIAEELHDKIKINPDVTLVPPGTFEKSTHKTPIFEKLYNKK